MKWPYDSVARIQARNIVRDVFNCDFSDLKAVIALAQKMGPGMVVVKHDDRAHYNITHATRPDLWDVPKCKVLHRT